jgi:hypothetical protein
MASKIVIRGGVARSVYDDRFLPIYAALGGALEVNRASQVEYDTKTREWVAWHEGRVIARGKVRADVIAAEVAYLERGL